MNNFFEKFKDFLYDCTDYIMMIIVILIVVLIIHWRLGGLFDKDGLQAINKDPIETEDKNHNGNNSNNDEPENINKPEDENSNEEDEDTVTEENAESLVKISIPSGSLPAKIGDILETNGLIENKDEFVKKTVELKMDTKLKCGDFEINKGSSIEEILEIITK